MEQLNHNNTHESNYDAFVKHFDLDENLKNKEKSALHVAYLIKNFVDQGMRVNFSYHSFVHGEEGDSEATFIQNRKGAIYFSVNQYDIPEGMNYDLKQFHYDTSQLALVSLGYTKLLKYINKMVLTKYPSDKQFDDYDSREKFAEKLYELKYEKFANGQLIARSPNRITSDNFNDFLNILLTDELIKEFDKIVHPENYKKDNLNMDSDKKNQIVNPSRFKI